MIYPCDDGCQCGQEVCISNNPRSRFSYVGLLILFGAFAVMVAAAQGISLLIEEALA